jgi:hypothetical protein
VLALDGHGGKTVARQRFGDKRVGQAAPAGEHGLTGVKLSGERKRGNGHDSRFMLSVKTEFRRGARY